MELTHEAEEEFNELPAHVRRLAWFFVEGGFGQSAPDWINTFHDYVAMTRELRQLRQTKDDA